MIGTLFALAAVTSVGSHQQAEPPRLVVVVSVDQMRADYFTRFNEQFTGGLRRLGQDAAIFTNAHQDHAVTATAPGHAAISTGVFPARNGIVSNDWWDRTTSRRTYAVEDAASAIVGDTAAPGRSPANLLRETVGDWLKQASPASKVFAVALKDRSAILMGGKRPDGVYWYQYDTGRVVTSTYYGDAYPAWVNEFNASGLVHSFARDGWNRLLPPDAYYLSREDAFPSEADGVQTTFPHPFDGDSLSASYYQRLPSSPFGDHLVFEFAKAMVTAENIGNDETPDLLLVGASAADFIGHGFGPFSQEVQDYYLRLDGMLKDFFDFLDGRVGTGAYTVVLTADHGVLPMPEELARRGVESRRVGSAEFQEAFIPVLQGALNAADITAQPSLQFVGGLIVHFPQGNVPADKQRKFRENLAQAVKQTPFVRDVFTYDELLDGQEDRPFLEPYRRSFHPDRAPDISFLTQEYYLISASPRGTSHGSAFGYDTHIPLIFSGPGVAAGVHDARVRSVDIAPTIAALLGFQTPADLDGRSLIWAVRSKSGKP